jgi:hypothetical protein
MAFTTNAGMLWLDDTLTPIATAELYQQVLFVAFAETTGPETGVTVQITTTPDGFTPTGWLYPPYDFSSSSVPDPVTIAPQTLFFPNTAPIPNLGSQGAYILIGGRFTSAGSKTFAVTVDTAQSSPLSNSATLTVAGGGPRTVRVDLYSPGTVASPSPSLLESDIPVVAGGYWTDEDSDAGAAEVTLPELGVNPANVVEGNLLRFYVNGVADRTALIERVRVVPRSANPSNVIRTLTGRDWIAEFDDALVNPPLGLDSRPQVQSVRFDWTHPQCPRPTTGGAGVEWIRPYSMGSVYKGDVNALAQPTYPAQIGKQGQAPRGWPDSFSGWMWERPMSPPPNYNHPVMTTWYHLPLYFEPNPSPGWKGTLCKANRPFAMVFTADDVGELAFDGAVVDSGATPPANQWQRCSSVVIPDVSEGWHHVTIKAQNRPYFDGRYNVGAVAFCAFQPVRDLLTTYDPFLQSSYDPVYNLVVRTALNIFPVNSQFTGTNLLYGDGWRCIGGVHVGGDPDAGFGGFQPPGFTVGMAFRLLFQSAQAQGHLPGWSLGFNDVNDSAGNPWPKTEELTAKVSDTLLAVIRNWHDEGHWDVAARASTRVLDAWVWQERGNYHLGGTPLTWAGDELSSVTIEGER